MSTASERVSRWSKRFTLASVIFLLLWGVAAVLDRPRQAEITLGLFGFVFHMIFGKGYALIPTYFDRGVEPPWLPAVQFPLTVLGTIGLTAGVLGGTAPLSLSASTTELLTAGGATFWLGGILVFVGGIGWTIRDNLSGAETATGEHNADRRRVDRLANLFVPIALAYLLLASYEFLATTIGLHPLLDGYPPRATHLLAVGTATLLVFAIGFRLFPRFLNATPPAPLVVIVLPLGALAPLGLAVTLPAGTWFVVFAAAQATAVLGYTIAIATLFRRADSPRIGIYGVLLGAVAGVVGVGIGLSFAVWGISPGHVTAHLRVNLLGFLGLTIVGATYQFYPPSVSQYPGGTDRTAALSMAGIAAGLALEAVGRLLGPALLVRPGRLLTLIGIVLYVTIIYGVFASRRDR